MEMEGELRRELRGLEVAAGPESIEVARVAHELARMLASEAQNVARRREAEWLYARALVIRRRLLAPDDPEVAVTLHDWAVLCEAAGDHDRSGVLWRAAEAVAVAPTARPTSCH